MSSRVALPPGIYSIQTVARHPGAVINPANVGEQLSVGAISLGDLKQQWIVAGDGSMTPMIAQTQYPSTKFPSKPGNPVSCDTNPYRWVINVALNADSSFNGWIMGGDPGKVYWGVNGDKIQMNSNVSLWKFVPV